MSANYVALTGFLALFALAWIGDVSAVVLIAIRTWQLVREPGAIDVEPQLKAVE